MGNRKGLKKRTRYPVSVQYPEKSQTAKMPGAIHDLTRVLKKLARKARRPLTLHIVEGRTVVPYPKEATLHIVAGAVAPGDVGETALTHACGIRLHERGRYLSFWGPTRGIGEVLEDEEKNSIGQVVDGTVYLFIPTPGQSHFLFQGKEGCILYKLAIERALMALKKGVKSPASSRVDDEDGYRQFLATSVSDMSKLLKARLDLIDLDIEQTNSKLNKLYTEKQTYTRLAAFHEEHGQNRLAQQSAEDWPRISAHPLVKKLRWVEKDALHVETRRIIAEHDGKHYDLGRFMIRIQAGGTPSIWSVRPTHPKRLAHPHISTQSVACFGNISAVLMEASGETRVADALELVIAWLTEGYDPALADAKIEEWPQVRTKKRRAA